MAEKKEMFLLDGSSLLHRAFYALPTSLQTSDGECTNAVLGFTKMLLRLIEDEEPDALAVAFDLAAPTFRHKEYKEYKAQRKETPDELKPQFGLIKEVLAAFQIPVLELEGYEADDVIGTLANKGEEAGYQVTVVTGDRDALQLVTDNTKIMYTRRGITDIVNYDLPKVREEYELEPKQLIDMKGLMGDKSDNIPGIYGIGEKTAIKLLKEFGTVEEVLANIDQVSGKKRKERLREQADKARLSKRLATIELDVPLDYDLDAFCLSEPDQEKLVEILSRLEFNSLLKELGGYETLSFEEAYILINKEIELDEVLAELKRIDEFAFKFNFKKNKPYHHQVKGLTIACNEEKVYYIDLKELAVEEAINKLKIIFEDSTINKLSLHAKENLLYLKEFDIEVVNLTFTPLLAGYLLRPANKEEDLEDLVTEYLRVELSEVDSAIQKEIQTVRTLFKLREVLIKELKDKDLLELFNDIEVPLIPVLAELELNGIDVDEEELDRLSAQLQEKLDNICEQAYELAGEEFNLNSPKQLGVILFEKLGLPVIKKTKTGYSTSASVLEELEDKHEIIPLILEYRQYQKLKSTYVDPLADLINPETGRIHTSFNQMVTATGRLSSTEPNLQNIPIRTKEGREIRKVFVAEEGKELLAIDYSQIELRVLAHISQDENLIDAFINNEDIHTKTAAEVFGVEDSEVTYEERRRAKAINFGIAYGISSWGLAKDINVSKKEAEDYINQYFERYPKVKVYMDQRIEEAKEKGYVKTILNRRRYLPEINSNNYHRRSFAERMAINTPIQGSAADIMKLAMLEAADALKEHNLESKMLLQVHDELVFEVEAHELEEIKAVMKEKMEGVIELDVPLIVDVKAGENWRDMKELE
ncbi:MULTISPECIES: DNA polymerase I [unclassified Candidatus Frackibacter]|uniref:DNA polymerase I n=1 Tax=unclassified Candidatus Frackibacter TaxID=2648818 RepID=UPI000794E2F1|nr:MULTISPECIES: DNA polymerase I [unclassified Candidatus Frackibacter]KXS41130.1 MAG: DNA polymerase I [Candidatus Frackibacter sp. T328-2]SDC30598.1 DNA polymerase I [Candidatus Frackibacter sp. WG11]SEM74136.1 DNA polymerase I [Candidatus Frackibacter sp. WG12]SFL58438.1 DNA polymerase I [Candidatus Frackibacter sp. WG13]